MKVNLQSFDKFINSPKLSGAIFIGCGAYKMHKDCQNAEGKHKTKFLIKDGVVLGGAALGMLAHSSVSPKILKLKVVDNLTSKFSSLISAKKNIEKPAKYVKEIATEVFSNFLTFASGIIGALGADYLLSKTGFELPEEKNIEIKKTKLEQMWDDRKLKVLDDETQDIVNSRITDMPQMKIFSSSLIGAQAIDLAKEKEFDKRLKHTTKCLITNSLLPLFFLSASSVMTNKLKTGYRIPIIFSALVGGTMLSNKYLDKYLKTLE